MAFYIYWNVKPDSGRTFLIPSDFEELLPLEQSREAFGILDSDGNNQLTPGELCRGVTQIYKCAPVPGHALLSEHKAVQGLRSCSQARSGPHVGHT